jgi:hypothetical protein
MSENRKRWWEKVNVDGEKWPGTECTRACLLRRGNAESMPSLFCDDDASDESLVAVTEERVRVWRFSL